MNDPLLKTSSGVHFLLSQSIASIILGLTFIFAGTLHFIPHLQKNYLSIMPPQFPFPLQLIYLSGCLEMTGGISILIPRYRRIGGIGLIFLLLAIFPANIYGAIHKIPYVPILKRYPIFFWIRLPLQFILIAFVEWSSRPNHKMTRANGSPSSYANSNQL